MQLSQLKLPKIPRPFKEDIEFLKVWLKNPASVGAVKPTSRIMARHMVDLLPKDSALPVLELGPGTGVITAEILNSGISPQNLVSVEYSSDFYQYMREKYPDISVIHGNAMDLTRTLSDCPHQKFAGIISGIPLLNLPVEDRQLIVFEALKRVEGAGPFIQFSYGLKPPVTSIPGKFTVEKSERIFRNLPPACIWIYRKDAQ